MSDLDGMLRAVLTAPADDTTRLAYADSLEESGWPERAEFVRVQVAMSANPPHKRTAYPDEPVVLRALGGGHYKFGAYTDDGFNVGDRVDVLRHREPKPAAWVYGLRVYKVVPAPGVYASREVDVYVRRDTHSSPWEGAGVKAHEEAILSRLTYFGQTLRGWNVHDGLFTRVLGVAAPDGHKMSIALFDAPANGRACLNFSFSRGNTKSTGDMRLYFDRGFACEWWCPLLDFREHAGFMFGAHPLTAVRLVDRQPTRYVNETHPDLWRSLPCEWSDFAHHGQLPGWLPRDVCPIGDFDSLAAAEEAVSHKAVAYGRLVGIPRVLEEQRR